MQSSRSPLFLVVSGLIGGLALGYALARFQSGSNGPEFGGRDAASVVNESVADERSTARRNPESMPPPTSPPETKDDDEAEQWKELAWEKEKQRRLDAVVQPTDTGLQAMRRIFELGGDPEQLFKDFDSFKRPLEALGDPEVVVHLEPATANQTLASLRQQDISGTLFIFSAGEFELREQIRVKDARHVVIRGQGPDRTIVKPTFAELVFSNGIDNLTIEEMTIDGSAVSRGVIDSRGASSFLLQRLRVFGFDASAGHSAAVGVSSECILAMDECEFLGGHGRGPFSGSAVSLRAKGLVYLRNCNMPELGRFVIASERVVEGSIVIAEDCDLPWNRTVGYWESGVDVRLRSCRFDGLGQAIREGQTFRDLGGNVFRPAEGDALPDIEDAVAMLESEGLRISFAEVKDSLSQGRGDAAYVVVTSDDQATGRSSRWFCSTGKPSRRTLSAGEAVEGEGPLHARQAAISASRALSIAKAHSLSRMPDIRIADGKIELESREDVGLVWNVKFRFGGSIRVDATSGALLE